MIDIWGRTFRWGASVRVVCLKKKISFKFALRLNGVFGSMRGCSAYVVWVVAMARGYCDGLTMGKQINAMEMSESVNGISSTRASC